MFIKERLNIVKMSVLPNLTYRLNAIPASYFENNDKLILKFAYKVKRPTTANTILKEKKTNWED